MLKKSLILFLSFIFCSNLTNGQEIGTWQSYTSKKEVVAITSIDGNLIWCATTGGAFMYEVSSNSFLQLGSSDGLSSPLLTSIAIDNKDQVWMGTQVGAETGMINVYDFNSGIVRKINDIFNSDFSQKTINEIKAVGDTILVSTAFGLSLINSGNNSFYDTFVKFGKFDATIPVLSTLKSDRFFVLTDNGIAVQKINSSNLSAPEAWDSYTFGSEISASGGSEFAQLNGTVLVATSSGVFRFNNNSWESFLLPGIDVREIFSNGTDLYLATFENDTYLIYEYANGNLSQIFANAEEYDINDIYADNNGVIYAATNSGLLKISSGSEQLIIPEGPANNSFLSMDTDDEGTLWVGTGQDVFGIGVMSFNGKNWDLINKESSSDIFTNSYHKIYVDKNTKYFCNWGRGLTVYKDGVFTNYNYQTSGIVGIPDDPTFLVVTDTRVDSKGNIWILNLQSADKTPLTAITPSGDIHSFEFTSPQVSESELAFHLEIDQFDTKWFAITVGDIGLYYFNENGTYSDPSDDEMGWIRESNGLLSSSITALALDKLGSLWVGTNIGVSFIPDPSNPTARITTVTALRQQTINDIEVDPLNQKWVATVQGLFHLSEDGTTVIDSYTTENSPLPSNDIKSVSVDGTNGIVYIGTDFGLTALKTSSVAPNENMDNLFVYPNPLVIKGNTPANVTIRGLISDTSIKVLSVSGQLIDEFTTPGGSIAFWDAKDLDGKIVPSGVYLIVAYDEEGSNVATAKVAVLRE